MIVRCLLMLVLYVGPSAAFAQESQTSLSSGIARDDFSLRLNLTEEITVSSNALDSPRAVTDRLTHVKLAVEAEKAVDGAVLGLQASVAAFQFDDLTFEDDRFGDIDVTYATRLGAKTALRGAIGYGYEDQGDDIDLGVLLLATRTKTHTLRGSVEIATALSEKNSLTVGLATTHDWVGLTEFDLPIAALRLSPDLNTTSLQLEWARRQDSDVFALVSRAELISLHGPVPEGSAIGSRMLSLVGRLEYSGIADLELRAEAGVISMQDDAALTGRLYPIGLISLARVTAAGTTGRLELSSAIDTADSDDPLGSRVHRAEFELDQPLFQEKLTVSAGIFGELRDNFAIGNREEAFGTYVAATLTPAAHVSLLFRLDYEERNRSIFETRERTLAGKLGLKISL